MLVPAESLATFRARGRLTPELDAQVTRELFVRGARLVYEISRTHVMLVALVHGSRDLETWRRERERRWRSA